MVFMSEALATKLLERNRVGALLRVFALTPEEVDRQTASVLASAEKLLAIRIGGRTVFSRIDILVSGDQDYVDSDCGLSGEQLRNNVLSKFPDAPVHVLEIKKGDIYCVLLNYGIANQLEDRIAYSMVISHSAIAYITPENIFELLGMMYNKARVAGLAINELKDLILRGRVSNVFSIWHNKSLISVGGFDFRAAQKHKGAPIESVAEYGHVAELQPDREKPSYPVVGSEEIIPLIRLVNLFGPCIGIVCPPSDLSWNEADIDDSPVANARRVAKNATKQQRQEKMAKSIGESLRIIEDGILHKSARVP